MTDAYSPPNRPVKPAVKQTREERLAAKLRENLRRRKVQARAVSAGSGIDDEGESGGLPKTAPES